MRNRAFFFRAIIPVICLSFFYLSHQLFRYADFPPLITGLLMAWIFLQFASLFTIIITVWTNPKRRSSRTGAFLQRVTYFNQGYLSYLIFLVVFRDLLFLIGLIFSWQIFAYDQDEALFALVMPPVFMLLGRLMLWTGPWKREVKIKEVNLSTDLDGFKIAQISDLHIGPGISLSKVQETVAKANEMNADIVVLTGDIVDHQEHLFAEEVRQLKNLKSKYGVFYVTGNHEYYWGAEPIIEGLRRLGIHALVNSNYILQVGKASVAVCGVNDLAAEQFSLPGPDFAKAIAGVEKCDYKILLSHQPKTADVAKNFGFNLQLSGHTHGGQFIPWSLIIGFFQKYTTGLYHVGKMRLYVNRGTGHWGPPDRLGTYSEITELILWQE
jgi:predicted MPP superfamily phosphohydrolase